MEWDLIWKAVLVVLAGTFLLRIAGRKTISQMTLADQVLTSTSVQVAKLKNQLINNKPIKVISLPKFKIMSIQIHHPNIYNDLFKNKALLNIIVVSR
jgi:hypothetical protein